HIGHQANAQAAHDSLATSPSEYTPRPQPYTAIPTPPQNLGQSSQTHPSKTASRDKSPSSSASRAAESKSYRQPKLQTSMVYRPKSHRPKLACHAIANTQSHRAHSAKWPNRSLSPESAIIHHECSDQQQ